MIQSVRHPASLLLLAIRGISRSADPPLSGILLFLGGNQHIFADAYRVSNKLALRDPNDRFWVVISTWRPSELAGQRPTTERLKPRTSHTDYPYVALRGPTYRENSHANHTWHPQSHQSACFKGSEAPAVWVRFPSPAPLFVVWRVPTLS
jgi:hypothetical protein